MSCAKQVCGLLDAREKCCVTLPRSSQHPRLAVANPGPQKPFRDFSRKKRNLLAWSLRAASASDAAAQGTANKVQTPARRLSTTVPSDLDGTDIGELFNMEQGVSGRVLHPTDRVEVDVDTLPTLEPYRREVVAQQPVTFGHRPLSASRMFNPCTMATSCGIPSDGHPSTGGIRGRNKGGGGPRLNGGSSRKRGRNSKPRRTTGLSAPMLKALLRGDTPTGEGGGALVTASHQQQEPFEPHGNNIGSAPKPNYLVFDGQEDLTDSSVNSEKLDESMWRSVDDHGRGEALGDLEPSWLKTSSQEGLGHGRRRLGNTKEGLELQRIFSSEVRNHAIQAVPQTTFLVPQHSWSMVDELCFVGESSSDLATVGLELDRVRYPTYETDAQNVATRAHALLFPVVQAGFRDNISRYKIFSRLVKMTALPRTKKRVGARSYMLCLVHRVACFFSTPSDLGAYG